MQLEYEEIEPKSFLMADWLLRPSESN